MSNYKKMSCFAFLSEVTENLWDFFEKPKLERDLQRIHELELELYRLRIGQRNERIHEADVFSDISEETDIPPSDAESLDYW